MIRQILSSTKKKKKDVGHDYEDNKKKDYN